LHALPKQHIDTAPQRCFECTPLQHHKDHDTRVISLCLFCQWHDMLGMT